MWIRQEALGIIEKMAIADRESQAQAVCLYEVPRFDGLYVSGSYAIAAEGCPIAYHIDGCAIDRGAAPWAGDIRQDFRGHAAALLAGDSYRWACDRTAVAVLVALNAPWGGGPVATYRRQYGAVIVHQDPCYGTDDYLGADCPRTMAEWEAREQEEGRS
jgi:hypothetical protein